MCKAHHILRPPKVSFTIRISHHYLASSNVSTSGSRKADNVVVTDLFLQQDTHIARCVMHVLQEGNIQAATKLYNVRGEPCSSQDVALSKSSQPCYPELQAQRA